ncbi:Pol polyprotein [Plakobranchus ocellatus]|uniref:Pol polyprotein n=1 Tax=Plakobranchus ocellatus TaxID=259542 RepID=A0AAV4AGH3_9GAST|nr:Pol polyprotein [Plakobranchus ocellatus]
MLEAASGMSLACSWLTVYRSSTIGIFSEVQVPEDHRQEVTTILKKNADVFAASDTDFGPTNAVTMTIDTGITKALVDLTKTHARFRWDPHHEKASQFLRDSLTVVLLLVYPNPNKPYVLYTDANDKCIGSCLVQEDDNGEEKPIYFLSHKLSDSQTRWSSIDKEAYAIFHSLQKLQFYLCNARFTIKTDHMPLIYLLKSASTNRKIQIWALHISAYDCTIEHIKGENNVIADLLSRMPSDTHYAERHSQVESEVDVPDATYQVEVLNSN